MAKLLSATVTTTDTVTPIPQPAHPAEFWHLAIEFDASRYEGVTNSRRILAVLNTALLTRAQWDVEIEETSNSDKKHSVITRVRILDNDDREAACTGGDLAKRPDNQPVRPFTPTAFANENPRKWGFFFSDGSRCHEYKGTSFDVYRTIEDAWLQERMVLLTFDGNDRIIAATSIIGD